MKIYREQEEGQCSFLISALNKVEWPASYPNFSSFWGNSPRYPKKKRLVRPKSSQSGQSEEKNLLLLPGARKSLAL
jgi:hypothetical protein